MKRALWMLLGAVLLTGCPGPEEFEEFEEFEALGDLEEAVYCEGRSLSEAPSGLLSAGRTGGDGSYPSGAMLHEAEGGGTTIAAELRSGELGDGCWRVQLYMSTTTDDSVQILDEVRRFSMPPGQVFPVVHAHHPEPPSVLVTRPNQILQALIVGEGSLGTAQLFGGGEVATAPPLEETPWEACEGLSAEGRGVEAGTVVDGAFEAFGEALEAEVVYGIQGSAMITPALQVTGEPGEGRCAYMSVDIGQVEGGVKGWFELAKAGDVLMSGALFYQIYDPGVIGQELEATVTVTDGASFWIQQRQMVPVFDRE